MNDGANFFLGTFPYKEYQEKNPVVLVVGDDVLSYFDTDNNSWGETSAWYPRHILPPRGQTTLLSY